MTEVLRNTRKAGTRPATDSLPAFDCGVRGCGTFCHWTPRLPHHLGGVGADGVRRFCSWGCVSRWAIAQELRS